jgi:hypothetical protein
MLRMVTHEEFVVGHVNQPGRATLAEPYCSNLFFDSLVVVFVSILWALCNGTMLIVETALWITMSLTFMTVETGRETKAPFPQCIAGLSTSIGGLFVIFAGAPAPEKLGVMLGFAAGCVNSVVLEDTTFSDSFLR